MYTYITYIVINICRIKILPHTPRINKIRKETIEQSQ